MKKPLILVTNDDGIAAPGLKTLVSVAKKLGDVLVVAPDAPQSGQGHAVTLSQPLRLKKVDIFGDVPSYECSGTPVDGVKLAMNILLKSKKVDLCVSGINHGSNASVNIIYSGTASAAMEASLEKVNSIAFSLTDYSWDANFSPYKKYIKRLMKHVLQKGMKNTRLWNVNIPNIPPKDIKGIKICRQGDATWQEEFVEATDPRGQKYYWLTGRFQPGKNGKDTDIWALDHGYISLVPSWHDMTKYDAIKKLKKIKF